jgi:hypothetical protein
MSAELDFGLSAQASIGQLAAAVNGLTRRMELSPVARVNESFRRIEFGGSVTLAAGAGTLQDFNRFGCPAGYYWSIRRLTVSGFTAGQVTVYRDSATGEPLWTLLAPASGSITVETFGKGHIILKSMSQLIWSAASITGTVTVWGAADQFYAGDLPWYMGAAGH